MNLDVGVRPMSYVVMSIVMMINKWCENLDLYIQFSGDVDGKNFFNFGVIHYDVDDAC